MAANTYRIRWSKTHCTITVLQYIYTRTIFTEEMWLYARMKVSNIFRAFVNLFLFDIPFQYICIFVFIIIK